MSGHASTRWLRAAARRLPRGEVQENVAISFGDIEFAYKPQKPDGSMGGEIKFGWDTRSTETR